MTPAPTTRPVVHLLTTRSRCSFASLSSVRGMEAWGSEQSAQSLARVSEAASDEGSRGLAMESCCVMASAMPELPSSALALTQASAKGRSPVPFRSTRFINATWSARSSRFWPKQITHRSTDCCDALGEMGMEVEREREVVSAGVRRGGERVLLGHLSV